MTTKTFDPVAYKETTRSQWQAAAGAWHGWGPFIDAWLGESTDLMLDLAGVGPGATVLDVAAGAGGQTFSAARRVGPTGRVLATDISEKLLAHLDRDAVAAGLTNVATRVMDGEQIDTEAGPFDAVISRVGLIYFPDQHGALVGMRRALRAGGRVAAIVYSTPEANRFFSIPVSVIRDRAQLPPPLPGQPGPFSLGAPGVLEEALTAAGFVDVDVRTVGAPLEFSDGRRLCPLRARVLRCVAPDAGRARRTRTRGGLGRDPHAAPSLRGGRRFRRAVRDVGRGRHQPGRVMTRPRSRADDRQRVIRSLRHGPGRASPVRDR